MQLSDFASAVEKRALDAYEKHGSYRKAAKELGLNPASVQRAVSRVKRRAASKGFAPEAGWTHPVPDPHYAKGISACFKRGESEPSLVWVKSAQDADEARAIQWREWREEFAEPVRGLGKLPPCTKLASARLCNEYLIGDPHIGMFAWAEETMGADWDLQIAERVHMAVIAKLIADSPPAALAHLVLLGDTTHADNYQGVTRAGGNRLDVDSRYPKMVRVAFRTTRAFVHYAAQSHDKVRLTVVPGNHDEHFAVNLAEAFAMHFEGDPRIEVDSTASPDKFFQWGKTLSMYTHGNRMKPNRMQAKLSRHPAWSETKLHLVKQGHLHHSSREDIGNAYRETFEVLPPADAWHAGEGYAAGRSMTRITYDIEHGEIGRGIVPVSMVE